MAARYTVDQKKALLDLASKLNNVTAACKIMGMSRISYYRIKQAYKVGDSHAPMNDGGSQKGIFNMVTTAAADAIITTSLMDPSRTANDVSRIVVAQGHGVTPEIVATVWKRNRLTSVRDRVIALLEEVERQKTHLTDPQTKAILAAVRQNRTGVEDINRIKTDFEERLRFENLISKLSSLFINLPIDQIDKEIIRGQQLVCQALGLHRSAFIEFSEDKQRLNFEHIWCETGISDQYPHDLNDGEKFLIQRLRKGKITIFSTLDDVSDELAALKRALFQIKVSSAIVFPLEVGKNINGGISWESHGTACQWTKPLQDRLRLISEVFAHALSRKKTESALRRSVLEIKELKDKLQAENRYLLGEMKLAHRQTRMVAQSDAMVIVLDEISKVAGTASTVLVLGETGTGKEVVAHAIHHYSPRRDRPMVKVNCSALPSTLIESELFGHEKGAFSGAASSKPGRFEVANGSTILLDEIGDLPLDLQPKLLRVLQEAEVERLGSTKPITVDVRVIAATNRDLGRAVTEGRFRKDLYYRLNVFPITVPPLRDRPQDIPFLVEKFIEEFSKPMGKRIDAVAPDSLDKLIQYDWPGNIRELRNLVERAMIETDGGALHIAVPKRNEMNLTRTESLDEMQRIHILQTLEKTSGQIFGKNGAASLLQINPNTLVSRMRKFGIRYSN